MIFESNLEDDEHADVEPPQIPKWAQTTLQSAGDLVGDPTDQTRTRYQFKDHPHALPTTNPIMSMCCNMALDSDLHTYAEAAGNPFWEATM